MLQNQFRTRTFDPTWGLRAYWSWCFTFQNRVLRCSKPGKALGAYVKSRMRSFVVLMLVMVFTGFAVGVLWWQSSRSQVQLREQVLLQAEQRSLHLADAMAGQVDGLFSAMDVAVKALRVEWAQAPGHFPLKARDVLASLPPGLVSHVSVVDAEGYVVFNSLDNRVGLFVGDRAYFKTTQAVGDELVIGEPVRSRLTDQWQFGVGRPLQRDGRFDGGLYLVASTEFLVGKLAALTLSEQDVVSLIHPSGAFLARSRDNETAMTQVLPPDRPYMTQPDARSGVYRARGQVDGIQRTYGWYRMPQSGAVVAIGLTDASVLAPLAPALQRGQWLTAALSLLILLGGGLITALLWRVSRSQAAVSEREAALQVSEARMKEAQQLAHLGSWTLDLVNDQLSWSDEIFRIFEVDSAQAQPSFEGFLQVVHPDDRALVQQAYETSVKERKPYNVEHRLLFPDGRVKHVREQGRTEYDGDQPLRSIGTVLDITEVSAARTALQHLNEELESRVAERTRELALANQELETFAYSVSHDLPTPLRSIHGFASLLKEEVTGLSAQDRSHLQRIQDAAGRMGTLITALLDLAHHSRAEMRCEALNLSELAHAIARELERGDPQHHVTWDIEDGLQVMADPQLMRVVLQNLLGNAWKYTGQQAHAQVSFTRTQHAAGMQTFCVRDNGAGFDMTYVQQLFQPFKRLHAHHEFEGSGVGLATVERVIQRHGGTVRAEGAVGQGAAFYFTLPDTPAAATA